MSGYRGEYDRASDNFYDINSKQKTLREIRLEEEAARKLRDLEIEEKKEQNQKECPYCRADITGLKCKTNGVIKKTQNHHCSSLISSDKRSSRSKIANRAGIYYTIVYEVVDRILVF